MPAGIAQVRQLDSLIINLSISAMKNRVFNYLEKPL